MRTPRSYAEPPRDGTTVPSVLWWAAGVESRVPRVNKLILPSPPSTSTRTRVAPQIARAGDAALVAVSGMVDELFPGFGDLADVRVAVIDLGGITFMTSFGVRQWLRSMAAIPASATHLYLLRCPTIIVDQLNMILNFGGRAKILSLAAPFICSACSASSKEVIDVLAEGVSIQRGELGPRSCKRCGATLVLDDDIESYFACLKKYQATEVDPAATALLANASTLSHTAVKTTALPGATAVAAAITLASTPRSRALPIIAVTVILTAAAVGVYLAVGPR